MTHRRAYPFGFIMGKTSIGSSLWNGRKFADGGTTDKTHRRKKIRIFRSARFDCGMTSSTIRSDIERRRVLLLVSDDVRTSVNRLARDFPLCRAVFGSNDAQFYSVLSVRYGCIRNRDGSSIGGIAFG